jgi:hypothetical protein
VIDGFLDILLPIEQKRETKAHDSDEHQPDQYSKRDKHQKLLFTVKSGGIAGYLGKSPLQPATSCLNSTSIIMQHGVLCQYPSQN